MRDNFEIIKPLLEFDEPNTFYFIQILKRKKENPDMKGDSAVMDNFYVYEANDLDKIKKHVISSCEKHNARAYINLNKLNTEKIALYTQKHIIDLVIQRQFRAVKNAYATACGNHHSQDEKRWVVDIDEAELPHTDRIRNLIQKLHQEITKSNYKILAEIPTKTGVHIITNPFNPKAFIDELLPLKITVQKNSPTVLYIS